MKGSSLVFCAFLLSLPAFVFAQAPVRKFPQVINRPNINVIAPFISVDGNTLLFTSDFTNDKEYAMFYSVREQVNWTDPVMLPKHLNNQLIMAKSYTLSPDGKVIYMTSNRSGSIGGYDIWSVPLLSKSVNDFTNLLPPINSRGHEASPTFTPDGNTMYFMRCEQMNQTRADKCAIFVSGKLPNGKWADPQALPEHINTGNSQTPRIGADGETLIFASNMILPNKGGMDLYQSRLINGQWTNPVPLDFVNTAEDDQYVSFTALGRYLLKDAPGQPRREISEFLFPDALRPRGVQRLEGRVLDANKNVVPVFITVTDLQSGKRFFSGRTDVRGDYFVYLPAGTQYNVSIDPEADDLSFTSKFIDLQVADFPAAQRFDFTMQKVKDGDVFILGGLRFAEDASKLLSGQSDLLQVARLIRSSPDFEIAISIVNQAADEVSMSTSNLADTDTRQLKMTDSTSLATFTEPVDAQVALSAKQTSLITKELSTLGIKPEQYRIESQRKPLDNQSGLPLTYVQVKLNSRK